jgi:hypothetical protein
MTDLEMTKRCAEAIGAGPEASHGKVAIYEKNDDGSLTQHDFNPLHDDAQAMALVKRFDLNVWRGADTWRVIGGPTGDEGDTWGADLNRAIVECVAKMQSQKPPGIAYG